MSEIPDDRLEEYQQQTTEEYAALGRYVQAFEYVCHQLRLTLLFLLQRVGLQSQPIAHILMEHKGMTAGVLLDVVCSVMVEMYGKNAEAMKVMRQFRKGICG